MPEEWAEIGVWVDYFQGLTWDEYTELPADVVLRVVVYTRAKDLAIKTKADLASG